MRRPRATAPRHAGAGASRPAGGVSASMSRRAPDATEDVLLEQEVHRVTHTEAGNVGGDVRETAGALTRRELDVRPGDALRDETTEEARREDVIALAVHGALQDVGERAVEIRIEVLVHREAPDALAALHSGALQVGAQRRAIGEHAAVAFGQRV